jgi:hypothetical protein
MELLVITPLNVGFTKVQAHVTPIDYFKMIRINDHATEPLTYVRNISQQV